MPADPIDAPVRAVRVAERRARLGIRHGLAPGYEFEDAVEAARRLVGLHASDPATPFLSARARVARFEPAELEEDLYESKRLTKHVAMRRTLFVLSDDLLGVAHAACSVAVASSERRRLVKMLEEGGVTRDGERWLRASEREVLDHLAETGPSTGAELSRAIPRIQAKVTYGQGKSWGGQVGVSTRVFNQLSLEGRLRRGRPKTWTTSQHRWELAASPPELRPVEDATQELVGCWLSSYGPATLADLTWWTGLGVTRISAALARLDAVTVDLDGALGYLLPNDTDVVEEPATWAAFLPSLDPTAMGWKHRSWYVGPHGSELFDRNGNIGPTVWADGRIIGGWAQADHGEVRYEVLEDVGSDLTELVERKAETTQEWLGEVMIKPRFPTPFANRLRT